MVPPNLGLPLTAVDGNQQNLEIRAGSWGLLYLVPSSAPVPLFASCHVEIPGEGVGATSRQGLNFPLLCILYDYVQHVPS